MTAKVESLWGGPTGEARPNKKAIKALEETLEAARSGEVIGVTIIKTHKDELAGFECSGWVGQYSHIGALETAKAHLIAEFHMED